MAHGSFEGALLDPHITLEHLNDWAAKLADCQKELCRLKPWLGILEDCQILTYQQYFALQTTLAVVRNAIEMSGDSRFNYDIPEQVVMPVLRH